MINTSLVYFASSSSLWTPVLLSNLVFFASADTADNFTFSSGSSISQWNDLSGNANHLTLHADYTQAPTYDSANKRVAFASGQSGKLQVGAGDTPITSAGFTMFSAFQTTGGANATNNVVLGTWTSANGTWSIMSNNVSSVWYARALYAASTNATYTDTVVNTSTMTLASVYFENNNKVTLYTNGVNRGNHTGSTVALKTDTKLTVAGASNNTLRTFYGYQEFVLGCSNILSDADRQKVEGWWAHTFNHTSLLDSGHPYRTNPPTV